MNSVRERHGSKHEFVRFWTTITAADMKSWINIWSHTFDVLCMKSPLLTIIRFSKEISIKKMEHFKFSSWSCIYKYMGLEVTCVMYIQENCNCVRDIVMRQILIWNDNTGTMKQMTPVFYLPWTEVRRLMGPATKNMDQLNRLVSLNAEGHDREGFSPQKISKNVTLCKWNLFRIIRFRRK